MVCASAMPLAMPRVKLRSCYTQSYVMRFWAIPFATRGVAGAIEYGESSRVPLYRAYASSHQHTGRKGASQVSSAAKK